MFIAFSDDIKKKIEKKNRGILNKDQIDDLIFETIMTRIGFILICVALDYFFRYLVVDALYHKFKDEKKPQEKPQEELCEFEV